MKTKLISSSILLAALCGSLHTSAQPANTDAQTRDRDLYQDKEHRLGTLEKANKIIGAEVTDSQDQKLGKVKDLAIDLQNGRIVEVIVGAGGMLGIDEQFVAVPPALFTYNAATKSLQLSIDKERLKRAPSFKISAWDDNVRQANVTEVYQYFGSTPYFTSETTESRNNTAALNRLGELQRADKVIGMTVDDSQNAKVGKIENLVVDLPAGRIVEVVVASGGFLGIDDELSAVPPQSFQHGMERDVLVLDTTKETLSRAPHFKSRDWNDVNNPDQVSATYRAYNVTPYFNTNAVDNTAQNVRDRQDGALTPLSQGTSDADVNTTRQIRQQITAIEGLSVDARNVKVITVDGKVTLRGPVDSESEKRQIADIAAKAATDAKVDDQLQVNDNNSNSMK